MSSKATELRVILDRQSREPRTRQLWLPPLATESPLPLLEAAEGMKACVGVLDDMTQPAQPPFVLDLERSHFSVVGGPGSGTSFLLATVMQGLAWSHPPDLLNMLVLDFGTSPLKSLEVLPHVAAVFGSGDESVAAEALQQMSSSLIGNRASGARWLVVVDDWALASEGVPDLGDIVTPIAHWGLASGVHLAISAKSPRDLPRDLVANLGTQLELRLAEPNDSSFEPSIAARLSNSGAGRGVVRDGSLFQAHLPWPASVGPAETPGAIAKQALAVSERWAHRPSSAPAFRALPTEFTSTDLEHAVHDGRPCVTLGLAGPQCLPVRHNFDRHTPHMLIYGHRQAGKSSVLLNVLSQLLLQDQLAHLCLVDLVGETANALAIPEGSSATVERVIDLSHVHGALANLEVALAARHEDSGLCVLAIDDADMVRDRGLPFDSLAHLVNIGHQVGFHVLLTQSERTYSTERFFSVLQASRHRSVYADLNSARDAINFRGRTTARIPGRGVIVTRSGAVEIQLPRMPAL